MGLLASFFLGVSEQQYIWKQRVLGKETYHYRVSLCTYKQALISIPGVLELVI